MDRKFLEGFGLKKEQIDSILDTASDDIGKMKSDLEKVTAERDGLQGKLEAVEKSLKQFEGVDIDSLQGEIKKLKDDLAAKDTAYQQQLAEKDFASALSEAITAAKGKNVKAVTALLDVDVLKGSNNRREDIKAALDGLKESDPYLFESGKQEPQIITIGSAGGGNSVTIEQFKKMGYKDRKKLKDEQPEVYKSLTEV